jgi:hypothetical protein
MRGRLSTISGDRPEDMATVSIKGEPGDVKTVEFKDFVSTPEMMFKDIIAVAIVGQLSSPNWTRARIEITNKVADLMNRSGGVAAIKKGRTTLNISIKNGVVRFTYHR